MLFITSDNFLGVRVGVKAKRSKFGLNKSADKVKRWLFMLRNILYLIGRILGDFHAIKRGRVGQRIGRRVAGKVTGNLFRKIFK